MSEQGAGDKVGFTWVGYTDGAKSRDAEVAELKQTIETLTAGFNEQGKVTIQNLVDERNDRRKEALELKDKLKEAMALLEMAEPVLNKHKYCSSVAMESLQLQNEIWNPRYEALKKNV